MDKRCTLFKWNSYTSSSNCTCGMIRLTSPSASQLHVLIPIQVGFLKENDITRQCTNILPVLTGLFNPLTFHVSTVSCLPFFVCFTSSCVTQTKKKKAVVSPISVTEIVIHYMQVPTLLFKQYPHCFPYTEKNLQSKVQPH